MKTILKLLNINYYNGNGKKDWMHCNSIDYNESLQQIVIGSRSMSEFYIIDHSTTTTQASTGSGGIYGKEVIFYIDGVILKFTIKETHQTEDYLVNMMFNGLKTG